MIVKELIDNSLDACEEANIAPEIEIAITTKGHDQRHRQWPRYRRRYRVKLLDYTKKTSSREAYVGPSRGAQGNALQVSARHAIRAGGAAARPRSQAHGVAHHITFSIDPVRREPKIEHVEKPASIHSGTSVTRALAEFS